MKRILLSVFAIASLILFTGCEFDLESSVDIEDEPVVEEDSYSVDAYVPIPYEVRYLIADRVYGYTMPPVSRYNYTLYPQDADYNPDNLPSYVRADFNGDGYSDYAYMFSKVTYSGDDWYLRTRLIIVVSTRSSYTVAEDLDLGSVTAHASTPVSEYWAIRLLKSGTHKTTIYQGDMIKENSIELTYDGLYLASNDPKERSVFSIDGITSNELVLDLGSIAKKKVSDTTSRSQRIIKL